MKSINLDDVENLDEIIKDSYSCTEVAKKIGHTSISGQLIKKIRKEISSFDTSHFRKNGKSTVRYQTIEKKCPVCGKKFKTQKGHVREKKTCSYACSNTYFRSGPQNGNWNNDAYRTTCFHHHEKKCIICEEDKIVEVHHYDGNNKNNDFMNLIPLCPTHHQYMHSRYIVEIKDNVDAFVSNCSTNKPV
jgi:hypothetical protein